MVLDTLQQLRSEISDINYKLDNGLLQRSETEHSSSPAPPFPSPSSLLPINPSISPELDVTIPPSHHSATEKFLSWEIFDDAPLLRSQFISTYLLESQRPAVLLSSSDSTTQAVDISGDDWHHLCAGYNRHVNFFYPVMSLRRLESLHQSLRSSTVDGCLAALVVALGDACLFIEQRYKNDNNRSEDGNLPIWTLANSIDGLAAFRRALGMVHIAMTDMSVPALLALLSTALYFTYLQRPLQVNIFLNACAQKCLTMMRYSTSNMSSEEYETVKRIFWSCFILER